MTLLAAGWLLGLPAVAFLSGSLEALLFSPSRTHFLESSVFTLLLWAWLVLSPAVAAAGLALAAYSRWMGGVLTVVVGAAAWGSALHALGDTRCGVCFGLPARMEKILEPGYLLRVCRSCRHPRREEEIVAVIDDIFAGVVRYHEQHGELPAGIGPTPAEGRCDEQPFRWSDADRKRWSAIGSSHNDWSRSRFELLRRPEPGAGAPLVIRAVTDRDCNGVTSVFEMAVKVREDGTLFHEGFRVSREGE